MNSAQSMVIFKENLFPPAPITMENGQSFRFYSAYISPPYKNSRSNVDMLVLELFLDDLSPIPYSGDFLNDKEYIRRKAAKLSLMVYKQFHDTELQSDDKVRVIKAKDNVKDLERYDLFLNTNVGLQDSPYATKFINRNKNGEILDSLWCNESNEKIMIFQCVHRFSDDNLTFQYSGSFTKQDLLDNWKNWRMKLIDFVNNAKSHTQ